jgi:hypothetical protein
LPYDDLFANLQVILEQCALKGFIAKLIFSALVFECACAWRKRHACPKKRQISLCMPCLCDYNGALSPDTCKRTTPVRIGPHQLKNNLIVAPMAGVTDRPFRQLCKTMGAGMAVSEMVASNSLLWGSEKTRRRANHDGEVDPISVQIAGADPQMLADAARYNVDQGAQIIDINMGCPAKKVCNVMAGSALLKDEPLVGRILDAVVGAVSVPVTLKIRTGWDRDHRNARTVARIAESAGIQALAIHGRTRACGYSGEAEYDTIAAVKAEIRIPVIANGDITTPGTRETGARIYRRGRGDDRPRGPGPSVDVPRNYSFSRHWPAPAAAGSGRDPPRAGGASARSVRLLR